MAGLIQAAQAGQRNSRPIYIAYDEWNVWYRARGNTEFATGSTRLEEIYNYEDALAMGMFFNSFIRRADVVKMANLAQLVNVIAPIFTNKQGLFLQPIYFPIAEYGKQRNNMSLNALVASPTYTPAPGRKPLGYLDVSVTHNTKENALYVNVLNRSEKLDIATRLDNVEGTVQPSVGVWTMNYDDFKATHTFGADKKIVPATSTYTAKVEKNGFTYTFPKHSLTILKVKLQ